MGIKISACVSTRMIKGVSVTHGMGRGQALQMPVKNADSFDDSYLSQLD